jgi:Caspase domain
LYALVIGIDNYQSSEVDNLYGACADADAISDYLIKKLNVPSSQITNLRNAQATRDNIISKICDLGEEDDHHVKHGDPILIFYAGHGASGPAPQEWGADSSKIQFIVPHDCRINVNGNKIPAIPDRTLGAFLRMLADTKGNNIVRHFFIHFTILCLSH